MMKYDWKMMFKVISIANKLLKQRTNVEIQWNICHFWTFHKMVENNFRPRQNTRKTTLINNLILNKFYLSNIDELLIKYLLHFPMFFHFSFGVGGMWAILKILITRRWTCYTCRRGSDTIHGSERQGGHNWDMIWYVSKK